MTYKILDSRDKEELKQLIESSGGGSAIKDGQLLLNGGLEIRTTNPYSDNAPTTNYIKIGENIDDNEPLTIKGWDTEATFGQDTIKLSVGQNGGFCSTRSNGITELKGESEVNIEAPTVTISGDYVQVVRNVELTPNSVITKAELDEALANSGGSGGDSAEDKANLEMKPINVYIGDNIYDLRVGSGIYTLEEIQEAEVGDGIINYVLIFDGGNIVFYKACTPEEFTNYGFIVGGNYRLTIDLDNRRIDKIERIIDLKDKANIEDIVGKKSEVDGEIFNDYENNQAGLKGFNITSVKQTDKTVTFTLDSTEGIVAGDLVSALFNSNTYDHFGKVTVVRDNSIDVTLTDELKMANASSGTLWIPEKPYIGTTVLGEYGFAANTKTKASAKAAAAFGENNVAGSKRAFVAGGQQNFAGYCCTVGGQNNKIRGVRSAGFGLNNDIATTSQYSFVSGSENKVRSIGTFVEGENNTDGYNSIVGVNHIEGADNVIGDGTYGRIHIEGEYNKVESDGQASHLEGQGNVLHGGKCNHMEGIGNEITGSCNTVKGQYNNVKGTRHDVGGSYNVVENGRDNFVRGGYHNVTGEFKTFLGQNSKSVHTELDLKDENGNPVTQEVLFAFGNGENVNQRNNALSVLADGTVRIGKASGRPDAAIRYDQFVQRLYKDYYDKTEIDDKLAKITETLETIETALDSIISIQESLIGGGSV